MVVVVVVFVFVFVCACVCVQSAVKIGPVWKNYSLEMVVVLGMALYLANYFIGRYKNSSNANAW